MPEQFRAVHAGRWLQYTQHKNRRRKPVTLTLPILPELETVLEKSATGNLVWLVTQFGKPHTPNGFGTWFRRRCDEAELPQCSAHGLRKAGATRAAENGATAHQLMAICELSNIVIQKPLASCRHQSGIVGRSDRAGRFGILPRRLDSRGGASVVRRNAAVKPNPMEDSNVCRQEEASCFDRCVRAGQPHKAGPEGRRQCQVGQRPI
jgi:hypothetical protein